MDWSKKKVEELKQILSANNMSVQGRKAELIERVKTITNVQYEAAASTNDLFANLPKNLRQPIYEKLDTGFYFMEKFELAKTLSNPQLTRLFFIPNTITIDYNDASKPTQTLSSPQLSHVRIHEIIGDVFREYESGDGKPPHKITFRRDHLSATVFISSRLDIQCLVFKPSRQAAVYELKLHGPTNYKMAQTTPYAFIFANFIVNQSMDTEFNEHLYGLGDVFLGLQWIQTFFLRGTGRLYKDILDAQLRITEVRPPEQITQNVVLLDKKDQQLLQKSMRRRLQKILKKPQ